MKLRLRFRLTLVGLLVFTAGAAIISATWSSSAKRQATFVNGVIAAGGNVAYDWQIDQSNRNFKRNASSRYPVWLLSLLGPDYFHSVYYAQLDLSREQASDLSFLASADSLSELSLIRGDPNGRLGRASMPNLKRLDAFVDGPLDLGFLAPYQSLNTVSIDAEKIRNVRALTSLPNLRTVYLNTNVIENHNELVELQELELLVITTLDPSYDPPLSPKRLASLRLSLPNCRVAADNTME